MNIQDNDWIIVKQEQGKPLLIQVTDAKLKKGYVERHRYDPDARESTISYSSNDVVCVLGQEPQVGQAFGIKIEPYRRTVESKLGPIHFYRKLKQPETEALKAGLKKARVALKNHGIKLKPVDIEIRNKKGKYAGMYVPARAKHSDYVVLCPEILSDAKFNAYVALHEIGHVVWARHVPDVIKTKWLGLYAKRMIVKKVKQDELQTLANSITSYGQTVHDYLREQASDEDRSLIKEVMTYLKSKRHLDAHDVRLMMANDPELLMQHWPTRAELLNSKPDISEYSLKDVRELFAEAFSFHLTGKILPKDIVKAIDYTFQRLTTNTTQED